jgi:chloride channel protein, CIC family
MSKPHIASFQNQLGDFSASPRLLLLAGMAVVAGCGGAAAAYVLLKLIALCTNLAYFQTASFAPRPFPDHLPLWTIMVPVIGGLIVGLMARYGSEKIRGHGIPEAIEAILIGQSRVAPKVALLKPLSSAIAIGTGGPFGAEGPIIMTGGALGSLFAQFFHLSAAERKTLLVAGAAAGMTAIFNTPIAAILLAVELLLFEWKPRSFVPVVVAVLVAALCRPFLIGSGAALSVQRGPGPALVGPGLVHCRRRPGRFAELADDTVFIRHRRFVSSPPDPLDVVAGAGWSGGGHRWLFRTGGAWRGL